MPSVLDGLNPEQREAASHVDGPCLVFAGAGSGKTRMLTHRIAHLVCECDVAPWHVLAVTFTNKAAAEMRSRVEDLVGDRARRLWMGTFHSVCVRLLREFHAEAGLERSFSIFDEDDRSALIRRIVKGMDLDPQRFPPNQFGYKISDYKNEMLDFAGASAKFGGPTAMPPTKVALRVYEQYEQALKAQNALDFDDLILRAVHLVERNAEVRGKLVERFRYVMVDEYQDINLAQYRLVTALTRDHRNLCVVGDDDQSIYGWRGARVEIILRFEDDFPEAKVVKLERNYRSTAAVLGAANAVISHNTGRREKSLRAMVPGGELVRLHVAQNAQDEAFYVADLITAAVRRGERKYGQFAVLYRTNAQSRTFEQSFTTLHIPYRMVGGVRFYERKEIRDLIAYLRALFNPTDDISLGRIINVPTRGIGDKTVQVIAERATEQGVSHRLAIASLVADEDATLGAAAKRKLLDFHKIMEWLGSKVETMPVGELIAAILLQTGYKDALMADESVEASARLENLDQLIVAAEEMAETPGREGLEQFLERVALVSDLDNLDDSNDSVVLMTLHSAKGLEFPVVFLVGLEEGLFPHGRSLESPEAIEEERRLCYVGMTRAKEQLYLTRAYMRAAPWLGRGQQDTDLRTTPSRFLREVPAHMLEGKDVPVPGRTVGLADQAGGRRDLGLTSMLSRDRRQATPAAPNASVQAKVSALTPPDAPYKAGEKVRHGSFGEGIVVSCTGGTDASVTIAFENSAHGVKKLLVEYAKLERI